MFTALICSLIALACVAGNSYGPSSDDRSRARNVTGSADTIVVARDAYLGPDGENYWKGTTDSLVVDGVRSTRILIQADQAAIVAAIGSGTLANATLELTVQTAGAAWPTGGATVDVHRVLQHWTEAEVTWVCADGHEGWDMSTGAGSIWQTAHTARTTITNGQTGVVRLDVTADVAAFLSGQANHGWVIKRTSEGTAEPGRISFASREGTPLPRLIIRLMADSGQVSLEAPDTIPSWVYADSNISQGSAYLSGPFVKRIVTVMFRRGTSQADRQAALDAVGGRVVGGRGMATGNGVYFVQVDDPGDGSRLVEVSRVLDGFPQVLGAAPEFFIGPNYLRPSDGPGWDAWQVSALGADGNNWAPEAVSAPLAWGCTTGSDEARVAVVDIGFQNLIEVMRNATLVNGVFTPANAQDHGTQVLSVLAARGNNSAHMTGLMWQARVELFDFGSGSPGNPPGRDPLSSAIDMVGRAAFAGNRVINLSAGIVGWPSPGPDSSRPEQIAKANFYGAHLRRTLLDLRSIDVRPLVVLAAGNEGPVSAFWNGMPAAKTVELGDQILVVTASNLARNLWTQAQRGVLVDLAAPGEGVTVLSGSDMLASRSGTSLAAPVVSGIAGLLLSFDPRLTTAELRQLVVDGAIAGGLTSGGYPIANAYHSLKLAAQRTGAPLCGNRIWIENGVNVRVERAAGDETIATLATPVNSIITYHGGRIVRHSGAYLRYAGGTWTNEPGLPPSDAIISGSFLSAMSWTHDRDSIVDPQWGRSVLSSGPVPVSLLSYTTFLGRLVSNVPVVLGPNEKAYVSTSPSPVAGTILVSVSIVGTDGPPEYSKRAIIYRLPWLGGTPTQVVDIPDRTVAWLGFAEDGSEFAVATGRKVNVPGAPIENCEVSFRSSATGNATRTVPATNACNDESTIAGGFAPLHAGGGRARH